jgi:hypothetical protein
MTTVITSRFSIPRVIEFPPPARTWSGKALLLKRPGTSITFSRNNGPSEALRAQLLGFGAFRKTANLTGRVRLDAAHVNPLAEV